MKQHIENRVYHVEVVPPKQDSEKLDADLELFATKFNRVMESGYCICITDNAMGKLSFQGMEMIEELGLEPKKDLVMIHLNTFHTKGDLDGILLSCKKMGIRQLLVVSGDGSDRLPKLPPSDIGATVESVTSVELLRYIVREYPGDFELGVAFNPYEPEEHEFEKMERKLAAGATFIITQPVIVSHPLLDKLLAKYPEIPVIVEAWMSKKLDLLSEAVGYEIPQGGAPYDPVENLKTLHRNYPKCGIYLSILGFKTQYPLLGETWVRGPRA